ncbi:MAG: SRPBCC family protein [Candidatus Hydrogenedentes bacterium]|nr:SRPBCC family protein [Candidatus Hydrogenedentota bacterium]
MIRCESSVLITKPAAEVFAFIDDFSRYPAWMESCVELRQTSGGPRSAGATLHYRHKQGGHEGEMTGVITDYEQGSRLEMKFTDSMFDVVVAFDCAPDSGGCLVTHSIAITLKNFMTKLMSPMIKSGNEKQVQSNVSRLKHLAEGNPG